MLVGTRTFYIYMSKPWIAVVRDKRPAGLQRLDSLKPVCETQALLPVHCEDVQTLN